MKSPLAKGHGVPEKIRTSDFWIRSKPCPERRCSIPPGLSHDSGTDF